LASSFNELVKGSAKGSLVLMIGQVIATIISALTIIWIARVIGPTSYGEYTVALIPASLLLLLQDLGINQALIRFCSLYRHEKKAGLRSLVLTGLLFSLATSLILSFSLFAFAEPIAIAFLQRPEVTPLVQAASLSILGQGLLSTVQAILVGYEKMGLRSIAQIVYSVIRGVIGVALILIGMGPLGAIISYTASLLISGLVGILFVLLYIQLKKDGIGPNLETLKTLLSFGFPLSLGTILGGVLSQSYNSLMVLYASTDMIGNYGATTNFAVLVTFFTVPITTVLFPLFSKFNRHDPQLKLLFRAAVKYTSILTLPVVLVIFLLVAPLSRVIFTTNYPLVPLYLSFYILNYAFEGLGGISLANLISAIGESRVLFVSTVVTFVTGILLALVLIPNYQIIGLLITMLLASRMGWLYQLLWVKKNLEITIDWSSTILVYFTSLTAFTGSYALINVFRLQGWMAIALGGSSFMLIYVICLPLSGALHRADIEQLVAIADSMSIFKPILLALISMMAKLVRS
jgi:O-antigen/teichoic acid export membrane protein